MDKLCEAFDCVPLDNHTNKSHWKSVAIYIIRHALKMWTDQ